MHNYLLPYNIPIINLITYVNIINEKCGFGKELTYIYQKRRISNSQ